MITPSPPPYTSSDIKDPQLFATPAPMTVEQTDATPGNGETVEPPQLSPSENKFKSTARKLLDALESFSKDNNSRTTGTCGMTAQEQQVYQQMLAMAESSPDPKVKAYYRRKAAQFKKSDAKGKGKLSNDITKGVILILGAPLALAAAGVVAAGGILYGTGVLIKGIGNAMTFGLVADSSARKKEAGGDTTSTINQ